MNCLHETMELSIGAIYDWCSQNYINVNVGKTKFCIYGNRARITSFQHDCITQSILRCLQYCYLGVCFKINNPRDMPISILHTNARVSMLDLRRDIQLLNIMFTLKLNCQFKKDGARNTRSIEKYVFQNDIGHASLYDRSPYIKGVSLWNQLPENIQYTLDKNPFKKSVKRHFEIF